MQYSENETSTHFSRELIIIGVLASLSNKYRERISIINNRSIIVSNLSSGILKL